MMAGRGVKSVYGYARSSVPYSQLMCSERARKRVRVRMVTWWGDVCVSFSDTVAISSTRHGRRRC